MKKQIFYFKKGELGAQEYGAGCDVPLTIIGALPLQFSDEDADLDEAIVTENVQIIIKNWRPKK